LPPVGRLFAPVPVPARPGVVVTCRSDDPGRREDLADPTLPIPGAAGVPNPPDEDFRERLVGGPIAPLPPDRRLSPFFAEDTIEVKLIRPPGECPPPPPVESRPRPPLDAPPLFAEAAFAARDTLSA
jgi:hypothetical protein